MSDWIKVDVSTSQKIEVFTMAEILDLDDHLVLGKLIVLWCWADANTIDGHAHNVTKVTIDRVVGHKGFANALLDHRVGWLKESPSGDLTFSNFDRHNGKGAKKRADDARRKAKQRAVSVNKSDKCPVKGVTKTVTREEKIREEENKDLLKDSCPELEIETHGPETIEEDVFIFLESNAKEQIPISETQVLEYSDLYPAVDCRQALRSMHGWLKANPKKRKTKRGMPAFVTNWLMREQDRGGNSVSSDNFNGANHGNSKSSVLSKLQQFGSELDELEQQLGERIPPESVTQDHEVCDDGIVYHHDNVQP